MSAEASAAHEVSTSSPRDSQGDSGSSRQVIKAARRRQSRRRRRTRAGGREPEPSRSIGTMAWINSSLNRPSPSTL